MIWIQKGRMVDPASGRDERADVFLDEGRIVKILPSDCVGEEELPGWIPDEKRKEIRIINAEGLVVAPGLVDIHVHFRDPGLTYKEDIQTGAEAAARGGFTTVVCMANTKPIVDNRETLAYVLEEGKKTGIHVLSCCAISKGFQGKELTDMEGLLAAGAAGFTDDGVPLMDEEFVRAAMKEAARLKTVLSFHEEDRSYIRENGINHGEVSEALGIYGSPAEAEHVMVERDCALALETGAVVDIQHISSGAAVDRVRRAKAQGASVWAEVTPHHIALTEEAVLKHGTLGKMNPPLRTEKDRRMLIEGLKDGTIDMIATDHAPHSPEEKDRPLTEAPSGILGLETALAVSLEHLVKPGHLTLCQLMEKMSLNPARLYQLDCGRLQEGAPGDLVIFDENHPWTVREFASKSRNSPFLGKTLTGKVMCTICGGKVVWENFSLHKRFSVIT